MLRQLCCHFYLSKISRRRRATSLEQALTGSWEPSRSCSRSPESDAKCQLQKLHTHACYCQVTGTDTDSYSHNERGGVEWESESERGGGTAASCYDCAVLPPSLPLLPKKKNYKIFNFNISGGWRRQLPSKLLLFHHSPSHTSLALVSHTTAEWG